jgi:copper chaperone CopZ
LDGGDPVTSTAVEREEVAEMTADTPQATDGATTAVLAIEGMHCASCVALIEETLVEDLGVARASVDLESEKATIVYDPAQFSVDDLCDAVVAAGYRASPA